MRNTIFFLTLLFGATAVCSQTTYKGLPVIEATKNQADYRVNSQWVKGAWGINPDLAPDVLSIPTFSRTVNFGFYTDKDSIVFPLDASKAHQFYVRIADGRYALTEVRGFNYEAVKYDAASKAPAYTFRFETGAPNTYLHTLKTTYRLDQIVQGVDADSAKALRVLKWVHDQWKHNGNNEPRKKDAISILEEAKEGKNFRCVEYGIVATAALNAIGLPARVLALKTKDVETTESGAGHVLLEVYLPDLKKWVLMDGQWDAMPVLNGVPLNAVEFQNAIANNFAQLEIRSLSRTPKVLYINWVYPYLYYLDVPFDNREGVDLKREMQAGKPSLMLVPVGAKQPTIFQKKHAINNVVYTHSLADFYAPPF